MAARRRAANRGGAGGISGARSLELLDAQGTAADDQGLRSVRPPVLESWRRSQRWQVCPDKPVATFDKSISEQNPLAHLTAADFGKLVGDLAGEPISIFLTDARGVVLNRYSGDRTLLRRLDRVNLAPGFSYSEEHMGTNGIGTALEYGTAILIHGGEHYAGSLTGFSCAGVPISHPITGRTLGVLDLTLDARRSTSLVLTVARQIAVRLQDMLASSTTEEDRALIAEFLRAANGTPSLIAVGKRFTVLSPAAQHDFSAADQATLLEHAQDNHQEGSAILELPSGGIARLEAQAAAVQGRSAGTLIRIQHQRAVSDEPPKPPVVPGLAGNSTVWRRVVTRTVDIRRRAEWLMVEGESGTGKLALLTAVERGVAPSRLVTVLDVATLSTQVLLEETAAALTEEHTLIIRHADGLGEDAAIGLSELLQQAQDAIETPFVALTVSTPVPERLLRVLMPFFPHTVRVPPLRHHMEDVPELLDHLLAQRRVELRFSPSAMAQLGRLAWPGNVAEMRQMIGELIRTRRTGTIDPQDLPARCRATARRQLTAMEWLERDAIVEALDTHHGDKQQAARSIGMSRATIYRKIRDYGLS
ncbi:transcriptional regulator of acetoin/glycerol metabolism [Propionibacteriaceae bacterium ES.041]|uniref:sigma-54-dependent Fis family transcriptional regulator n=1 Tax=Enemella evansiae TaxID=2016499 RepID=UPI000C00FD12|nr:helix-turn-helix domain-containing protein [Enemella evansiae]PFG65702.1 transcriptional regulator of acetoin/glycerol metabolism [Propionibacteriaceae bacterium ES.041]